MQNISTRVKKLRASLKLSQSEFGARMRYGRHYISLLERGKADSPSPRFLEQLAFMEREVEAGKGDYYTSERVEEYSANPVDKLRSAPSKTMPPPHVPLPAYRLNEDPLQYSTPVPSFGQCVKYLSELHERHPEVFRSAAVMIKGLYESITK